VSSSEAGQRVVHHTNVIDAAKAVRVSRILYTSMLNTDVATNPFSADHRASELALRESGVEFTLLRNGLYTEGRYRPFARIPHQWGDSWRGC